MMALRCQSIATACGGRGNEFQGSLRSSAAARHTAESLRANLLSRMKATRASAKGFDGLDATVRPRCIAPRAHSTSTVYHLLACAARLDALPPLVRPCLGCESGRSACERLVSFGQALVDARKSIPDLSRAADAAAHPSRRFVHPNRRVSAGRWSEAQDKGQDMWT